MPSNQLYLYLKEGHGRRNSIGLIFKKTPRNSIYRQKPTFHSQNKNIAYYFQCRAHMDSTGNHPQNYPSQQGDQQCLVQAEGSIRRTATSCSSQTCGQTTTQLAETPDFAGNDSPHNHRSDLAAKGPSGRRCAGTSSHSLKEPQHHVEQHWGATSGSRDGQCVSRDNEIVSLPQDTHWSA